MDIWNYTMSLNETEFMNFFNEVETKNVSLRQEDSLPLLKTIAAGLLLGFIILATIAGNVLVLLAVYVNSHLRSTTNFFIVNLAVADLLLGITVLPFSATLETLHYWPFGYMVCDIWASADVLWCTASILTLCVISIDRYIGVTRPLQHSSIITERRALWIIVFVWILSVAISIAPLTGWKEKGSHGPYDCTVTKEVGYVIFSVAGSFYIPMLIILFVYAKIYREATKHSKFLNRGIKTTKIDQANGVVLRIHTGRNSQPNIPQYQSSRLYMAYPGFTGRGRPQTESDRDKSPSFRNSSEHSEGSARKFSSKLTLAGKMAKFKKEKKAAKTLGIVVGVFLICWFPFFFCLPLDVLCESCHVPGELFTAIFWLGYCNSLMNPIIYASSSREFKRAFVRVIRCQCKRKPRLFLNSRSASSTELRQFNVSPYGRSRSLSVNKRLSHDDILIANYCLSKRNSDSPMISLRVFQDQRKLSSYSSNFEHSDIKSSTSELADDEYSEIASRRNSTCNPKNTVVRISPQSDLGSFAKDEHYINTFRNLNNHTVL